MQELDTWEDEPPWTGVQSLRLEVSSWEQLATSLSRLWSNASPRRNKNQGGIRSILFPWSRLNRADQCTRHQFYAQNCDLKSKVVTAAGGRCLEYSIRRHESTDPDLACLVTPSYGADSHLQALVILGASTARGLSSLRRGKRLDFVAQTQEGCWSAFEGNSKWDEESLDWLLANQGLSCYLDVIEQALEELNVLQRPGIIQRCFPTLKTKWAKSFLEDQYECDDLALLILEDLASNPGSSQKEVRARIGKRIGSVLTERQLGRPFTDMISLDLLEKPSGYSLSSRGISTLVLWKGK